MYVPTPFEQSDPEVLHALIRERPLATLLRMTASGLQADAVPLQLRIAADGARLLGHVARANPLWRDFDASVEALAIFHGGEAYVSPSWYPAKREHGRVVPTWNYILVQARGPLIVHDDAAWLREQVKELTATQEAPMPAPWGVDDAPAEFIDRMLGAIVGIEMPIRELRGKWKLSQNRNAADRQSVIEVLRAQGSTELANRMFASSPTDRNL